MDESVTIELADVVLNGFLNIPKNAKGMVLFVHGSGSGRHSQRNQYVARVLQKAGIATLLFDLLSEEEDQIYANRFEIDSLTHRLLAVTNWLEQREDCQHLLLGYFGASTGAAAAIKAAAVLGDKIKAIVSRGGRPDLALDALAKIKSPILLMVGGADEQVILLNEEAYLEINAYKMLKIIPGATHLFEEEGALEQVAELAAKWFLHYLT